VKYAPAPEEPRLPAKPETPEPAKPVVEKPEPAPAKPEVKEATPARPAAAFKRRDKSSEEDLRKQLLRVPEVALDDVAGSSARLHKIAQNLSAGPIPFQGPASLLATRTDLEGLPLRMGDDCRLGKEPAENMQVLSRKLRAVLEKATPKDGVDPRPDAGQLREALLGDPKAEWLQGGAVPCLLQLLQAENSPVRRVLVDVLGKIADRRATEALAARAMMDLNPDVREAAARELLDRAREDYEPLLLAGLRYPWAPVATHAAEALVFLRDADAVPQLARLLDQPDATAPFAERTGGTPMIREVVRVNHLSNCMLCHPPSLARTDLVRGAVPAAGQPLPPPTASQYYDNGTIFVRADTTYLRQDFSVMQPAPRPNKWPEHQRFDYVVRVRPVGPKDATLYGEQRPDRKPGEGREALLFVLRELTGKDPGAAARDARPADGGAKFEDQVGGDWRQFVVAASAGPDLSTEAEARRLTRELFAAAPAEQEKVLSKLADARGLPYTDALADAAARLEGPARERARDLLAERLARMTDTTLRERLGDGSPELQRAAARAAGAKQSRALVPDLLPLLSDADAEVAQVARLALKALTDRDFGPAPDAEPAEREKAAAAWNAWWKKQSGA
jgi:HEAT repeat protein